MNICYIQSIDEQGIHINNDILPVAQRKKSEIRHLLKKSERLTFTLCNKCENCPELNTCPFVLAFTAMVVK